MSEEPWNKGPLSARGELLLVLITLQSWRELWENVGQEPARAEVKGSLRSSLLLAPKGSVVLDSLCLRVMMASSIALII